MITPRRTRLVRAPDLRSFRRSIATLCARAPESPIVLVPSAASRRQLLRSIATLADGRRHTRVREPTVLTRDELYEILHSRLRAAPRRIGALERQAMAQAAAATVHARDGAAPFPLRPGLIAEMFRFYDQLRRQSRRLERFQELVDETIGGGPAGERGTDRLLAQTRLLAAIFREYEQRVEASGGCDEHTLRERLLVDPIDPPATDIIVTIADWIAEPDGLFVSDFDLLAQMPAVQRIDLVCTEPLLGSGFHERLHDWWPGVEELEASELLGAPAESDRPLLETPGGDADARWFTLRDRYDELSFVAQRVKGRRRRGARPSQELDRMAIVAKRPLPYLVMADATLGAAGLPFCAFDPLPLTSAPVVATLDLVLDAMETRLSREAVVALLASPFLQPEKRPLDRTAVQSVDTRLRESGYLGDTGRLREIAVRAGGSPATVEEPADSAPFSMAPRSTVPAGSRGELEEPEVRRSFESALEWADQLTPFFEPAPASEQLGRLRDLLAERLARGTASEAEGGTSGDWSSRTSEGRARDRMLQLLTALADAYRSQDDPLWTAEDTAAAVRTCIERETLDEPPDRRGIQLLDDRAARYGEFDDLTIVGLTDTDWPERQPRNIFYPSSLLRSLGWPSEHTRRRAADARFLDLMASPAARVAVTTIALDDEAIVMPSLTLDEIPRARLTTVPVSIERARLTAADALSRGTITLSPLAGEALEWARLRLERSAPGSPAYHGSAGPLAERAWSVSALEVYLTCPFKFFARHVLRLEEEIEESDVMDPREQGQFVHAVFEAFFEAWRRARHGAITPDLLDEARRMFAEVVDEALTRLPDAEAGLERTRLLGSSAAAGLGEAVLRMEAERPTAVVERLLEHRLEGHVTVQAGSSPRSIRLRGKADRIDLLEDGTFRLIDYKLGWPPQRARALQLPVYALAAEQQLAGRHGRDWTLGEAVYLAFKGPRRVVPLVTQGSNRQAVFDEAGERLVAVVDAIGQGEFPPTPADVYHCERCGFAGICRKDYVGDV